MKPFRSTFLVAPILLVSLTELAHAQADAATVLRTGLGPESLAAAGIISSEVATVLGDLEGCAAYTSGDLATADADYRSARVTVDELRRVIKSGQATQAQVQQLQTAKTDLAQAETDRQTALDALFDAGAATLTASEKATLAQIAANAHHRLAADLLVVSRTDSEWIALKKALKHEKVRNKDGEELHADVVGLLADVRGDTAVATAKAGVDANLASVTAAWNSATD